MKLLVVLVAIFALTLLYTPQQASGNRAAIAAIPKLLAAAGIEPPGAARHQAPTSRATSSSGGCAVTTAQTAQGAQWTESNYVYQVYDLAVTNAGGVIITDVQLSITLASDAAFAQSWGIDAVQGSATRYKLTNWGGIQAGATQSAGYIVRAPLASGVSAPVVVVESATCADGSAYHPPSPSPSPVPSPATSTLPKIPTNAECPPTYYTESYWKANGGLSRHLIGSWEGIGKFSVVDKASGVVLQALDVDDTWTVVYNHSTGGLYWIDNFLIVGDLSPGPADYFDRYLQAPGRTCTHQTETPIDNNVGKEYDFEDSLQLSTLVDRNTGELTMSCSYKFEPGWTRVQVDCALFDNMVNYVPAGMLVQYHIYMVKQS